MDPSPAFDAYSYLTEILDSVKYQKDVTLNSIEQLRLLKIELMALSKESVVQRIKEMNIPNRVPIVHSIDDILSKLPNDLIKRYNLKFVENKEFKAQKPKLKINWTIEEIDLLEKKLLADISIDGNHKQRLQKIARHLPSKSVKQIQVRMNKFYLKQLKENKPLLGARYSPVIPEKKRGRPSKLISSTFVSFADYQKNEEFLKHDEIHYGHMCDGCSVDPIIGTRYRCNQCQVDVCDTCLVDEQHLHETHSWSKFEESLKSANAVPDEYAYLKGIWGGNK